MDADSLFQKRVRDSLKQPDTIRGRAIMWYASIDKKQLVRVGNVAAITVIVILHTFLFVLLLHDYLSGVSLSSTF